MELEVAVGPVVAAALPPVVAAAESPELPVDAAALSVFVLVMVVDGSFEPVADDVELLSPLSCRRNIKPEISSYEPCHGHAAERDVRRRMCNNDRKPVVLMIVDSTSTH